MPRAGAPKAAESPTKSAVAGRGKRPSEAEPSAKKSADKSTGKVAKAEPGAKAAGAAGRSTAKAAKAPAAPAKAPQPSPAKADAASSPNVAPLPAKTIEKLRKLLESERETYLRQAEDLAAEAEALATDREQGDTQFDEESGEGDTLNVERERDLALSASARVAVEAVDRALARMDAGTFGVCERCGKRISVARLEALPHAALCIDCKSREERRR